MRSQQRSQFEHNHRRRADRAAQIMAINSFTRDGRRAHWQTSWGKLGPDRNGAEMVARAPCACRPEGKPLDETKPCARDALTIRSVGKCSWCFVIVYQCPNTH